MKEATHIALKAKPGKQKDLAEFLTEGAKLVAQTEPETLLWVALKNDDEMMIFDTFSNDSGRKAHFVGKVAAALKENAENLVEGGWDGGVVANIKNPKILSGKTSDNPNEMKVAIFIPFKAKTGQAGAVAEFLTTGASIVEETEPKTAYWYALQFSDDDFGIIDFFADMSDVDAHFAGQLAAAVNENAEALIVGGWDDGVIANIKQFDVLAMTCK